MFKFFEEKLNALTKIHLQDSSKLEIINNYENLI